MTHQHTTKELQGDMSSILVFLEELFPNYDGKVIPSLCQVMEYRDFLQRVLILDSIITTDTVAEMKYYIKVWNHEDQMKDLSANERIPIKLYINSDGGSLIDAMALIDYMQASITPIYTINEGSACSAGGLILMAGHKRFAYGSSIFLLHDGSTAFGGDLNKVIDMAKFTQAYENDVVRPFVLAHTNITLEDYETNHRRDWFMTTKDMLKYGVIDEVITRIITE